MSTETAPPPPPTDTRERLRQHFLTHDPSAHGPRWEALWTRNDVPWDQGTPNPALIDLLDSRQHLNPPQLAPPTGDKKRPESEQRIRRPRALVPGCGRGYDVLLLASYGFDAYGVETAETALKAAREGAVGHEEKEAYKVADEKVGRGVVEFVQGDFFDDAWWTGISADREGFDLVYDYTFLCALPPKIRSKWAARMAQLLAPKGKLVCLEFPTYKLPSTGGPPWAVRPATYVALLSNPGEEVQYDEEGFVKNIDEENPKRSDKALVRQAHFQPERTHEIGKGTDWVSVWAHQ